MKGSRRSGAKSGEDWSAKSGTGMSGKRSSKMATEVLKGTWIPTL